MCTISLYLCNSLFLSPHQPSGLNLFICSTQEYDMPEWLLSKSLQAINAGEGVEKREPSYSVGGNANQYSHYGEQCGDSLKKLEIELLYDPASPLLGIHTEETRIERDKCTPMFIAALFIIARTWKQPRCPSADEWIRKLWYIWFLFLRLSFATDHQVLNVSY